LHLRSFKHSFSAEIRGLVDLYAPLTMEVLEAMARKEGIRVEYENEKDRLDDITRCRSLLVIALERDLERDILRTIHIQASHVGCGRDRDSNRDHIARYVEAFRSENSLG
jgi:hypothetical protein